MQSTHRLGLGQGTAMYMGAVLGPGVLALPALAAQAAGPASVLAWVGLLALSIPVALSFAALGAQYPDGGGVASFVARAFGHRASAPVGWWFYLGGVPVGVLGGALVGGQYVAYALGLGAGAAMTIALVLLLAAFLANYAGLHVSGRMQLVLVGLLVALLTAAVLLAAPHATVDNFTPFAPHGWAAIGHASTVLFYAFSGWEAASHLSGEFADPRRHLRKVTVLTLTVVGVLYLGLALTTTGVLGGAGATSQVPLMLLLEQGIGPAARVVTAVAAVLLTFGAINAYIAGGARLGAALGRDGALPAWFDTGTAAGDVPRRSLSVLAGLVGAIAAATIVYSIELDALMRLTSVCLAAVTVAGMAAAIRLLPRGHLRIWAVVALGFTLVVLAFCGVLLVVPIALGIAAVLASRELGRRQVAEKVQASLDKDPSMV